MGRRRQRSDGPEIVQDPGARAALLQPLRRRILLELRRQGSAASLARRLRLPRQKVNYHLRRLEKEGLLVLVGRKRRGNCTERILRATAESYVVPSETLGARDVESLSLETEVRLRSAADREAFALEVAEALGRLTAKYQDERGASDAPSFRLVVTGFARRATEPESA